MAQTSILQAVKAQIIADLAAWPALADVTVVYSLGKTIPVEVIYGGTIRAPQTISGGRSLAGIVNRHEVGTLHLHVRCKQPGGDNAAAEARAYAVMAQIEAYFAGTGPVVTGLIDAHVAETESNSETIDEAVIGVARVEIAVTTYLD